MRPRVWAPAVARLEVVVEGDAGGRGPAHLLTRDASGWHVDGPDLAAGTRYRLRLDGDDDLVFDPRSHFLPDGIGGSSQVVDHDRFAWTDRTWHGFWLPGSVLYELHVGTFTSEGTFDAAAAHLDELVDLGVDAVEVMPVAEFVGDRGWGYDGVAWWAPHHAYGGPDGFKRFVDAAHARGLGVLLDVVYNHLGPVGNHLARFGPWFHDAHHTPWGAALNLDGPGADEVRAAVVANARHWFERYHLDGLRLDAVHALVDDSAVHVAEELAVATDAVAARLGRPLWLVAETDRADVRAVLPREANGWGLAAHWADDLHHALHAALTGERDGYYADFGRLDDVARVLRRVHLHGGERSPMRRRVHGRAVPDEVPGHRFVVCAQNHDQIGNRAAGERLSHLVGVDAALVAATVVLTSPGTPLLFQGEEWAASTPWPYFCDVPDDPDLADAIRRGRRREFAAFGWAPEDVPDPLSVATATAGVLRREEQAGPDHARARSWYRSLLGWRRALPGLADGDRAALVAVADEEERTLVVQRPGVVIAANLGDAPAGLRWPGAEPAAALLGCSRPGARLEGRTVVVPAMSAAVVTLTPARP